MRKGGHTQGSPLFQAKPAHAGASFLRCIRKIARGRARDARPPEANPNRAPERTFLLNIGPGNGACDARIYFPISSFKAAYTFQFTIDNHWEHILHSLVTSF